VSEISTFFTFTRVRQSCFVYNVFGAFFNNFFNGFKISVKFCVFFREKPKSFYSVQCTMIIQIIILDESLTTNLPASPAAPAVPAPPTTYNLPTSTIIPLVSVYTEKKG
jgi:hypothetical protein